jgi:putative membrane protein
MMHTGALGALLAVANAPWYPAYIRTTTAWGLTAVEDQQIAGLVMWVPAGLSYIAAALWLFSGWLSESGRRTSAREARAALDAANARLHSTHSVL